MNQNFNRDLFENQYANSYEYAYFGNSNEQQAEIIQINSLMNFCNQQYQLNQKAKEIEEQQRIQNFKRLSMLQYQQVRKPSGFSSSPLPSKTQQIVENEIRFQKQQEQQKLMDQAQIKAQTILNQNNNSFLDTPLVGITYNQQNPFDVSNFLKSQLQKEEFKN